MPGRTSAAATVAIESADGAPAGRSTDVVAEATGMKTTAARRRSDPALCDAAAEGDLRRVRQMLQDGASPDSCDEEGTTALMASAFAAQTRVVQALLAAGADPDLQDVSGLTALMNAVIADGEMDLDGALGVFSEIVDALLAAGADPDIEDEDGMTARDHAAAYDLHEMVLLLESAAPARRREL